MRTIRTWGAFLAVALVVAACGNEASRPPGVRTLPTLPTLPTFPTGANEVVIRVDSCCGLTTLDYQLGMVPSLTIYGDGRVITEGPVSEQYPPHALPNLLTGHLDRGAIARLIRAATLNGLLAPMDAGHPSVKDNPTTTVTINTSERHTQEVYALGFTFGHGGLPGVTGEQRDARRRIESFVTSATRAATNLTAAPYRASEVALYVELAHYDERSQPAGSLQGPPTAWPLGSLGGFGHAIGHPPTYSCGVLTGTDAATVLDAAGRASSITRWSSGGTEFHVVWRPLLPDEHSCPYPRQDANASSPAAP